MVQAKVGYPTVWNLPDYSEWDAILSYLGGAGTAEATMRINNNYYYTNQNGIPARWTNSAGGVVDYAGTTIGGQLTIEVIG